jgi:hypothetical protein
MFGVLVRLPSSMNAERRVQALTRVESCPPAPLLAERPGWVDRFLDWLGQDWHATRCGAESHDSDAPSDVAHLALVRHEFTACLDDIATRQAADLAIRIGRARSLRELWHLRAEVFNVVSCHTDQREARERLTRLNRHFPVRAPRSGFGGFDATPHDHHRG